MSKMYKLSEIDGQMVRTEEGSFKSRTLREIGELLCRLSDEGAESEKLYDIISGYFEMKDSAPPPAPPVQQPFQPQPQQQPPARQNGFDPSMLMGVMQLMGGGGGMNPNMLMSMMQLMGGGGNGMNMGNLAGMLGGGGNNGGNNGGNGGGSNGGGGDMANMLNMLNMFSSMGKK